MKFIPYYGNKRKEYISIKPYINLENIEKFIDVFGGSGSVGLNVKKDNDIYLVYNDTNERVVRLVNLFNMGDKDYINSINTWNEDITQQLNFDTREHTKEYFINTLNNYSDDNIIFTTKCLYSNFNNYCILASSYFNIGVNSNRKGGFRLSLKKIDVENYHNTYRMIDEISKIDYKQVLNKYNDEKNYLYLDPPYINNNHLKRRTKYTNKFDDSDIQFILNFMNTTRAKVMLNIPYETYQSYESEYNFNVSTYTGNYGARSRNQYNHAIITNFNLT